MGTGVLRPCSRAVWGHLGSQAVVTSPELTGVQCGWELVVHGAEEGALGQGGGRGDPWAGGKLERAEQEPGEKGVLGSVSAHTEWFLGSVPGPGHRGWVVGSVPGAREVGAAVGTVGLRM